MPDPIITQYRTPAGTIWDTHEEAIIAHRIEAADIYIESYKLKAIVQAAANTAPEELPNETN